MIYSSFKEAISDKTGIAQEKLYQSKAEGLCNCGIFIAPDRVFKVTANKREIKASQRLIGKDFTNVVKIYSVFEICVYFRRFADPTNYYVIEQEKLYRDKHDKRFCALEGADIEKNPEYYIPILKGMAELKSVGITHLDVSSWNILRDMNGTVKLIDFGIVSIERRW